MYIFEDKRQDLFSQLFRSGYPADVGNSFIYTDGAGNLVLYVEQALEDKSQDDIYVFMDVVADNRETVRIYQKLRNLSIRNSYRIVVFPLVCSEFYFIQSIASREYLYNLISDNIKCGINICVNKEWYRDSPVIQTDLDREFTKSFEKYCKLLLLKESVFLDCVRHSRGQDSQNSYYGNYYLSDCPCTSPFHSCIVHKCLNKALDLLKRYPCIPSGTLYNERVLSENGIWDLHRCLVEAYNEWCRRLRNMDSVERQSRYKEIKTIK